MRGYDQWLTTNPMDNIPDILIPGDPGYPICSECGCFLKRDTYEILTEIATEHCDGTWFDGYAHDLEGNSVYVEKLFEPVCGNRDAHDPHDIPCHGAEIHIRMCKRCNHINREVAEAW